MDQGAPFQFTAGQTAQPVPVPVKATETAPTAASGPIPVPTAAKAAADAPAPAADPMAAIIAGLPDHLNPAKLGALPPKQFNSPIAEEILDKNQQFDLQTKSGHNKKAAAEARAKIETERNAMLADAIEVLDGVEIPAAGNDDLRAIRRRGARISMQFLEKHLPSALATLVSCMSDPFCSAQQLKAAMEVIRITALDPTALIGDSVEVVGDTVQEQLDCITRLYSSGAISAAEQTALLQGVKMKAEIMSAQQADELALLTAELKDRLNAEKAKSGRVQ